MPRFNNKSIATGKKIRTSIGISTSPELKKKLEILSKYYKRTLSDFCKIELENVIEREENQEILNKVYNDRDN